MEPSISQPRALAPRRLDQRESIHSLNHWKSTFRNYYRRCQYYGLFLLPDTTWDNSTNRGFTQPETTGLKRNVQTLAADLAGFLDCVGSYLPFDYVSDKLQAESTSIESVWDLIYELYDAELSTSNFLDYATMNKLPEETYRSYFNRLVGFIRQHLPNKAFQVEGFTSPRTGEKLTVALLDTVTIHWLLNIDRRLVNIVKTEFATELKTKRLSQLVKQIAQNIDDWLLRYDTKDYVNLINTDNKPKLDNGNSCEISSLVRRIEKLESKPFKKHSRLKFKNNNKQARFLQCSHCTFLNKQLGSTLDTNHNFTACGKRSVSISLLESLNVEESSQESESSSLASSEGDVKCVNLLYNSSLQRNDGLPIHVERTEAESNNSSDNCVRCSSSENARTFITTASVSDVTNQNLNKSSNVVALPGSTFYDEDHDIGNNGFQRKNSETSFSAILSTLQSSTFPWTSIDKSSSPKIKCRMRHLTFLALIDSGAEVNALDRDFALSLGIGMIMTKETARAANRLPLDVCGQTSQPVVIECSAESTTIKLELGIMLIIANLGTECLLGEPAKIRNNLICLPRQKIVVIAKGDDVHYVPYSQDANKYSLLRALSSVKLNPGEQLSCKLPESLSFESCVAVSPRLNTSKWLKPSMQQPCNGAIFLTNSSTEPVYLKKSDHLADVRDSIVIDPPVQPLPGKAIHPDVFQFSDFAASREISPDYLAQVQVDPDNRLSESEKSIFHELHKRFASLFTPQPGRYNGYYGYIDNKLQFATQPPPNTKTRIPNYSPSMNNILAQKMDLLEQWGVLAEPEVMGVSVEYISPNLLLPKPEKGEYRLVTDFSSLNVYLKKVPNMSPTIAQAKSRIARAEYVIHLDLANYFYQNGLQLSDTKYLGTIHPFKGVRTYTCDPQGLKGASERSYEKLARIFGDLVQQGKLAQMADGLHVLGNSIQELATNYTEVLNRAELCRLTFKPAKVIICPRNIKLFGWELRDNVWFPTSHTTSALINAPKPTTVKQLRSFLGSFKQLSASLPKYAATVHNLEKIVAGKASAERLHWTDELNTAFENAKLLAAHPHGVAEPRPQDKLSTYSDYSADNRAVGGRLVIHRQMPDGTTKDLIGGFYSTVLDKHKQAWLPCEGEAAGIRLVLDHFRHQIRESDHTTTHYTDSQPCVLAWKRSRRGAFSTSARISAFLTGLSTLPVELQHKAGKDMHTSDYASRHPSKCTASKCQICSFAHELQDIGDNSLNIRSLTIQDIKEGTFIMPFTQTKT